MNTASPPPTRGPRRPPSPGDGRRRLTLVLDPRFPGGTASAVAEEILAFSGEAELSVVGIDTAMFPGRPVNPRLADAIAAAGVPFERNPRVVRGDCVVFHNPAALKFDAKLGTRISCDTLYVVTHETFFRPNGSEAFDVDGCLERIASASVVGRKLLAPVGPGNRRAAERWLAAAGGAGEWELAPFDWFNICAFPLLAPAPRPQDRRGRHSRPGPEKFPALDVMLAHFPSHARSCTLLGADLFLREPERLPKHWRAIPFGGMEVERFLGEIDFFVYFTNPLWRESFGRSIAEAIAAGKLVITDPETASAFGPGVVASDGRDVDAIVERFVAAPDLYARHVLAAQARLADRAAASARARILGPALFGTPAPPFADAAVPVARLPARRAHADL